MTLERLTLAPCPAAGSRDRYMSRVGSRQDMGPLNGTDAAFERSRESMGGDVVFTWGIVSARAARSQRTREVLPGQRIVASRESASSGGTPRFGSLQGKPRARSCGPGRSARTTNGNRAWRVFAAGRHGGNGWDASRCIGWARGCVAWTTWTRTLPDGLQFSLATRRTTAGR